MNTHHQEGNTAMTSERRAMGFGTVGAAMLLSAAVLAHGQSQSRSPSQQPATAQGEHKMSMDDMMKGCREHCQATTKSIDQMTKTMDEAKASNDPAKMRAALDQAAKPLADMKNHMSMCMNMMEKMHGKGGMMAPKPPQENR